MTIDQIKALEWAVGEAPTLSDDEALTTLRQMLHDATVEHLSWDASRRSLCDFLKKHNLTVPTSEFDNWRMLAPCDQRKGQVNALNGFQGIVRATNGILAFIEKSDGTVVLGHFGSFTPDPDDSPMRINKDGTVKRAAIREREERKLIEMLGYDL